MKSGGKAAPWDTARCGVEGGDSCSGKLKLDLARREGRKGEGFATALGTRGQTPNSKASGGAPVKLTGGSAPAGHDGVMGGDERGTGD